ncbi:MAG: hypothetical protein Q7R47_05810 [Candidatus Diapherotrites archaeon]|nr:hypothetical protein [Candidatus Diapherotrites archaeon]
MADDVPRRMRRFDRRKQPPQNDAGAVAPRNAGSSAIPRDHHRDQAATPTGPQLRYWDQRDPSLDELSSSLFEQLETEQKEKEEPVLAKPFGVVEKPEPMAPTEDAPPKEMEKESFLDVRRKKRLAHEAQVKESATVSQKTALPKSFSPSAGNALPQPLGDLEQSVRDLDIRDLLDTPAPNSEKPATASGAVASGKKEQATSKPGELDLKKDASLLELEQLKLDDPELEKLKKNLKKSWDN